MDDKAVEISPPNFEERKTGITLEAEATVSPDAKSITLTVTPTRTVAKGSRKIELKPLPGSNDEPGKKAGAQPDFDTLELPAMLTLESGKHAFLGAYRDPVNKKMPAEVELFLLKAEVRNTHAKGLPAQ